MDSQGNIKPLEDWPESMKGKLMEIPNRYLKEFQGMNRKDRRKEYRDFMKKRGRWGFLKQTEASHE